MFNYLYFINWFKSIYTLIINVKISLLQIAPFSSSVFVIIALSFPSVVPQAIVVIFNNISHFPCASELMEPLLSVLLLSRTSFVFLKTRFITTNHLRYLSPSSLNSFLSKNYSNNRTMKSMFITGITDGDGNFSVSIIQSPKHKLGWVVQFSYSLVAGANPPNHNMLLLINSYFNNKGTIVYKKAGNCYILKFSNLTDCLMIREHFLKYPLLTSKLTYFQLWSRVLDIIASKKHLTSAGLLEIVSLKAQFNDGLSPKLLENFPSAVTSFKFVLIFITFSRQNQ